MTLDHDALLDIAKHAIAAGAKNLGLLLGVDVEFGPPVGLGSEPALDPGMDKLLLVETSFTEGIDGEARLVLASKEARQIVELMLAGKEPNEEDFFGEPGISVLREAMSHFVTGMGTAIGERTGVLVELSTPAVSMVDGGTDGLLGDDLDLVLSSEGTIGPTPGRLFWTMTAAVAAALASPASGSPAPVGGPGAATPPVSVSNAGLGSAPAPSDLGRLADVKLDVSVELGRCSLPIQELLALDEGGVIRLGRRVGEPVDLMVNGLTTPRGEIVVVDGRLGLRVTELIA